MVASLIAYVALHDHLFFGSSTAVSVRVMLSAITLDLVLKRISRVGVPIV